MALGLYLARWCSMQSLVAFYLRNWLSCYGALQKAQISTQETHKSDSSTADLVEILAPAKTCFCVLSHPEMGCVKPQKCSSDCTSSICAVSTIKANPAFLDCGARHSQYRPASAALCQWAKYSKTIIHLVFLQAAAPGQPIPAACPCAMPSPAFWQGGWQT